jgi:hypothetical protein
LEMKRIIKAIAIVLGWAVALDAFTLWAIFQGLLLPQIITGGGLLPEVINGNPIALGIFYSGIFGTSVLAALVIYEVGQAIISFFASYFLAAILNVIILSLPDITGTYNDPIGALTNASVNFTLTAFFPLPLIVGLVGTLLGIGVAERYL